MEPAPAATFAPGQRLAVVVDRSLSMEKQRTSLEAAQRALAASGALLDIVLTSSTARDEPAQLVHDVAALDPKGALFFGASTLPQLLAQHAALQLEAPVGILVLTDDISFDLATDAGPLPKPAAPLVLVHHGGVLPRGYDDATGDAVRASGGTIATTVEEALAFLARRGDADARFADGWRFSRGTACDDDAEAPRAVLARAGVQLLGLGDLDQAHAVAKAAHVVTPLSSMIALVDEAQRKRLAELEADKDRFAREVEANHDVEAGPVVMGTPEPGEWLLVLLASAALVFHQRRRRADVT
jgi:hypothetical protein